MSTRGSCPTEPADSRAGKLKCANPETALGFVMNAGEYNHSHHNPLYDRNLLECSNCNIKRTSFEYVYGKYKVCRVCRDRGVTE